MSMEVIQWGERATVRVIKAYDIERDDWITTLVMEHEDLETPYVRSLVGYSLELERKMWFAMGRETAKELVPKAHERCVQKARDEGLVK